VPFPVSAPAHTDRCLRRGEGCGFRWLQTRLSDGEGNGICRRGEDDLTTALSKRVSLGADGKPVSDGSECVMANGTAVRCVVDLRGFAALIESCTSQQAISLGTPRSDLPDGKLSVVTKNKWNKLKDSPGVKGGTVICRTTEFVGYQPRMGLSLTTRCGFSAGSDLPVRCWNHGILAPLADSRHAPFFGGRKWRNVRAGERFRRK
jgi:hypothetical protein